jgi:hypothetical protein
MMVGANVMLAAILLSHPRCLFAEVFTDSFKLEMEKLVDAKEFGQYQKRMCEVADGILPGVSFRERVFSVHFMFEALGHRVPVDLDVVEKSIERIIEDSDNPDLVSDAGDQLVFEAHHLRIRLLTARGQFPRAAEESEELTIRWERKLGRLMNSSQYLPKLWCQAGQPNRARRYVDRVTGEFPNSYPANAAVRVKFAQYLNDTDNPSEAFLLLHELRESFPIEFAADVFAVQNYVDYASQLPLKGGDLTNQETMLDVQKFVDEAELQNDFTPVKATLAYGRAKIEKRLGNDEKAKEYFGLAKLNANTDNFGKTLVAWSDQEIKHMELVKQQKLESKENFKSVHDVTPEPTEPNFIKRSFTSGFLIILNGCVLIALIYMSMSARKAK